MSIIYLKECILCPKNYFQNCVMLNHLYAKDMKYGTSVEDRI
jgi:hypothetical protein